MLKKRPKGGNGEGTIFQRKRDGVWMCEITLGWDSEGKRKFLRHTGRTRKEVAAWRSDRLSELQKGTLAEPSKQTIGEYFSHWIETTAVHEVKPATLSLYRQMLKRHIKPGLGDILLSKLKPQDIQSLYHARLEEGLSGRSVQILHSVLHRGLDQALAWGLVVRNVSDAVKRPRAERHDRTPLDVDQAEALLKSASDDRLHAVYYVALYTGLRLGEILALRWQDIDLTSATLSVSRTLTKIGEHFEIGTPKTAASRRTIDLSKATVSDLRKWRREQVTERLVLGEAWATDLVFTTAIGTPLSPHNVRNRSFRPVLQKAGLPPIRFHDLRHTAATMMLSQGVQPRVVMDVLGHADIRMTMGLYAHVMKGQKRAAADAMESLLARG